MSSAVAVSPDAATIGRWRSRATWRRRDVDPIGAERAAADLLVALGFNLADENLVETPRRMARALIEMTSVPDFDVTTFANDGDYDELVLVQDLPVQSLCEHHMLPFVGVAHIGYLPGERILGLSKFARLVEFHARHPQTQERLTKRIADHLQDQLEARGVGVVVEAEHTCMSVRGARAPGARTTTSALVGQLRNDPRSRAEFLALTKATR
jgi:GTP cyclohydrolase I